MNDDVVVKQFQDRLAHRGESEFYPYLMVLQSEVRKVGFMVILELVEERLPKFLHEPLGDRAGTLI
jgi:hypothetical protein